jgi:hypothetical protein
VIHQTPNLLRIDAKPAAHARPHRKPHRATKSKVQVRVSFLPSPVDLIRVRTNYTMRFGLDLPQHMVPEWALFYVPYNSLKISLRAILEESVTENTQPDFSGLSATIFKRKKVC